MGHKFGKHFPIYILYNLHIDFFSFSIHFTFLIFLVFVVHWIIVGNVLLEFVKFLCEIEFFNDCFFRCSCIVFKNFFVEICFLECVCVKYSWIFCLNFYFDNLIWDWYVGRVIKYSCVLNGNFLDNYHFYCFDLDT